MKIKKKYHHLHIDSMATISITIKHGPTSITIDEVPETSTLAELMELIDSKTGVIPKKQKLLCKGKVLTTLPGSTTLTAANVVNGSKLMLLQIAGGSVQTQGAATLQAVKRAKSEAPKRLRHDSYVAKPTAVPTNTLEARQLLWCKTGIVALRDLKLTELPTEMFSSGCVEAVRVADLGGNQLSTLPESLGQLNRLQKLRLSLNNLTDSGMPWDSICGSLTQLVVFALDHNNLTFLPPSLSKLTNLQKLALDHNQLKALPEEIGKLKCLKALNMSSNTLTALPASLGTCFQLEELSASGNPIEEIPPELGTLVNLKTLLLDKTK